MRGRRQAGCFCPVSCLSYTCDLCVSCTHNDRRTQMPPEIALEVLVAADMLNLQRLVQLSEIALQPVIDAGNAVPLYLAAEAHGAKQLSALCRYVTGITCRCGGFSPSISLSLFRQLLVIITTNVGTGWRCNSMRPRRTSSGKKSVSK